ncbi:hypothetical protein COE51_22095 [Bacillus pseudomycoides]|nr:hypothetical protein COE51_22095 [Bacillus pseudomycoides]
MAYSWKNCSSNMICSLKSKQYAVYFNENAIYEKRWIEQDAQAFAKQMITKYNPMQNRVQEQCKAV